MNRRQRRYAAKHPAPGGERHRQLPPGTKVTIGQQRMNKFLEDVADAEARKALRERGLIVPEAPIERKTREMTDPERENRTPGGLLLPR